MSTMQLETPRLEIPSCPRMPGIHLADGVYRDCPMPKYLRTPAANVSLLKAMRTPAHARAYMASEDSASTPTKEFGTLVHLALLEPERFARETCPPPINDKTGEPYGRATKAWSEYAAKHAGKSIITDEERGSIRAMKDAIMGHAAARELIEADGMNEVCLRWTDAETGIPCKGRVDRLTDLAMVDLKTTESADADFFARSVISYGYHMQAAFYQEGAKAVAQALPFRLIVVESEAPHAVQVFDLSAWASIGLTIVTERLAKLAKCIQTNEWPAYGDATVVLPVPAWYGARFTDGEGM